MRVGLKMRNQKKLIKFVYDEKYFETYFYMRNNLITWLMQCA